MTEQRTLICKWEDGREETRTVVSEESPWDWVIGCVGQGAVEVIEPGRKVNRYVLVCPSGEQP